MANKTELMFRSYLDVLATAVVVLDAKGKVVHVNRWLCDLVGRPVEEIVGRPWVDMFVVEEARPELKEMYEFMGSGGKGKVAAEADYAVVNKLGGQVMIHWVQSLIRDKDGKVAAIVLSGGEKKSVGSISARRDDILSAISQAAERFLHGSSVTWAENVNQVIAQLGDDLQVRRIFLCKHRRDITDKLVTGLQYEWVSSGAAPLINDSALREVDLHKAGYGRWDPILKKGDVICGQVDTFPKSERGWFLSEAAQNLIVVPVFVGKQWWGFIGFEDYEFETACSQPELDAFKSVALTFGAAIWRKRTEEALNLEKQSVEQRVQSRTQELEEKTLALEKAKEAVSEGLERQKLEKARLTASIHSMSLGFLMTDMEKKVLLFNHAVNGILGSHEQTWTMEMLISRLQDVFDIHRHLDECIHEGRELSVGDIAYKNKFLRFFMTPIKMVEEDGRVIGAVILIEDITEAKKLQRARDEFFAVAAHELRTPLSAIRSNASMIKDYYPEVVEREEVREVLDDIYDSSVRLIDIVNNYLDVSRLEMSKVDLTSERFDMVRLVKEVMKDLEMNAHEKNLDWQLQVDDGDNIPVYADKVRTQQVLFNLLGNALKYTKQGGVYVKIGVEEEMVRVHIYDTGVGIDSDDQWKLFQKFRQVGDRVYDASAGSGMGLYITKLLAEAMGGQVYLAKSQKNVGSEFVLALPRSTEQ